MCRTLAQLLPLILLISAVTPAYAQMTGFRPLPELSKAESWKAPTDGVTIAAQPSGIVTFTVGNLKQDESRVVSLVKPVPMDGADALNYWICFPSTPEEYGISVTPLFTNDKGKEVRIGKDDFIASHTGMPNARRSGFWCYNSLLRVQRDATAVTFTGIEVKISYLGSNATKDPHTIYLKDFGLERTDYHAVPLYYMVGGFRDNYADPSFNNMRARALTSENSGMDTPYVLLDNLLDQVKEQRPAKVNLRYYVYDINDRLVHQGKKDGLKITGPNDFFAKVPVPITQEGTYNIKCKTFNADTGEYFTTDWVKLVVLKGKPAQVLPVKRFRDLLAINADKPYGKIEKADKKEIVFQIGAVDFAAGPVELRYTLIPSTHWTPGRAAARPVKFDHTVAVTNAGALTVPYEQKRTVELIVAELRQGDRCLDREERLIGVANAIDKNPKFIMRNKTPSLSDLAGPGKVWVNTTTVVGPGTEPYETLARDADELKKISPNLGFILESTTVEPIPGVYDWDSVTPCFDLAVQKGCRIFVHVNLKMPMNWTPLEFVTDDSGCVHRNDNLYSYMAGKYLYFNGTYSPGIRREFITQLARRYLNHPGLLGYYIEEEHADTKWLAWPVSRSYDEANRKAFTAFATARYGTIEKLNVLYGTTYTGFDQVQLPDPRQNARKVAMADFLLFRRQRSENAVIDDQVEPIRAVDPRRPIIVYIISLAESDGFLRKLMKNDCMMANGGIHSDISWAYEYERYNAIPGLRYRMEPHSCWFYDPMKNGYDEMIFGMLAMGGRGLNFHFYVNPQKTFKFDEAMKPGQPEGYDKLMKYMPVMRELSSSEKQHDPIGILDLYNQNIFGNTWGNGTWTEFCSIYVRQHYCPRFAASESDPAYLMDSGIVFVDGDVVGARQIDFMKAYLRKGGHLVIPETAGKYRLEDPDNAQAALISALGLTGTNNASQLPDLKAPHTLCQFGKGQALLIKGLQPPSIEQWTAMTPALLRWSGVTTRLADSADPDMQIHVLQNGKTFYLATTHRNELGGPENWSGQVRWCAPLPDGNYRLTELMSGTDLGVFTPAQLSAGFDAGAYGNLQMKIFKITSYTADRPL